MKLVEEMVEEQVLSNKQIYALKTFIEEQKKEVVGYRTPMFGKFGLGKLNVVKLIHQEVLEGDDG